MNSISFKLLLFLNLLLCTYILQAQDALHIDSSGNVGVGISNPVKKFEINGDMHTNGHAIYLRKNDHDTSAYIKWNESSDRLQLTANNGVTITGNNAKDSLLKVNGRIKDQTGYLMPVGSIIAYAGTTPPEGWLLCDGSALDLNNHQEYADLSKIVGNNVPDLRSRFIVGAGLGAGGGTGNDTLSSYPLGQKGGQEKHTLTIDEMPKHQHFGFGENFGSWVWGTYGGAQQTGSAGGIDYDNYWLGTTFAGGDKPHENRPPYYALTYIIKF